MLLQINAPVLADLPAWISLNFFHDYFQRITGLMTRQNITALLLTVLLKFLSLSRAVHAFVNPFALRLLRLLASNNEMNDAKKNEENVKKITEINKDDSYGEK